MEPYIGQILMVGFTFAPPGWLMCDGSLQSIASYDTLFNLIGTTYGGDGVQTFGLPDLRARVPVHQGQGQGLSNYIIGQSGGVASVNLNTLQLPSHTHALNASSSAGTSPSPGNNFFAAGSELYNTGAAATGNLTNVVSTAGAGQPHDNLQPYIAINYIIAVFGIYPTQN